jgi:hypothetical protein
MSISASNPKPQNPNPKVSVQLRWDLGFGIWDLICFREVVQ